MALSMGRLNGAIHAARVRTMRFQKGRAQARHNYLVAESQFTKKR